MNHAPTAHATTNRASFTVKFSYKPLIYFASGFFLPQISQAFWLFAKTIKQLIINHLRKTEQKTLIKNTLKHLKIPPKSSPFTRSKHSFDDVKGLLWACKSYAFTSENTKTASRKHKKHLPNPIFFSSWSIFWGRFSYYFLYKIAAFLFLKSYLKRVLCHWSDGAVTALKTYCFSEKKSQKLTSPRSLRWGRLSAPPLLLTNLLPNN